MIKFYCYYRGENMNNNIPLWFKAVYFLSIIVAFHFFLPSGVENKFTVNEKVTEVDKEIYNSVPHEEVLETFSGELTGYGPDCTGCSGKTASGYDVRNGNIYYEDAQYGKVRIIATDKKYQLGSIIRITVPNVYTETITAIVLDRGGAIRGSKVDLLFEHEGATGGLGRQKDVKFEVLRYGW
jgi:3D (Asp-Asp-Asp) domain-containing protein